MARYFLFLYVDDISVKKYLDHAIYVLNPREKWPAHVTIAGPFDNRRQFRKNLNYRRQISVIGCGRFINGPKHSVFLNVASFDLSAIMDKPSFPNAKPHLTLYDGRDHELADLLYERLSSARVYGRFVARSLDVVESEAQFSADFALEVNMRLNTRTESISYNELVAMGIEERVSIALSSIHQAFDRNGSIDDEFDGGRLSFFKEMAALRRK